MSTHATPHEHAEEVVSNAYSDAKTSDLLEARVMPGGEQMLPNTGGVMYFRNNRLEVRGDMTHFPTLREVSRLCEEYGLHVDREKGVALHGEEYAILRVDLDR